MITPISSPEISHYPVMINEVNNIYIFDPFDKFCDTKYCYSSKGNTFLYEDDNHLSKEGAIMISKELISMIVRINSQKVQ